MNTRPAREAQTACNKFLFEVSLLAGELDVIRRIENPEQRTHALRRGQEAYEDLLVRGESLQVSPENAPLIRALLERIRAHLANVT